MSLRPGCWLLLSLVLAACTHAPPRNPLAQWVPSNNEGPRLPILIVIHATEQESVHESLDTLRGENSTGPVSAHYLIGRDGERYQLVADERRAWHAGSGRWGTITDLNSASIGIELDNDGGAPFPAAQIESLLILLDDLCTRHRIPRTQVIAHADLAPVRKSDPNHLFPWQRLAQAGFGIWPQPPFETPPTEFDPWMALRVIGYSLEDPAATVRAFHRRFRGVEVSSGDLDGRDLELLYALMREGG